MSDDGGLGPTLDAWRGESQGQDDTTAAEATGPAAVMNVFGTRYAVSPSSPVEVDIEPVSAPRRTFPQDIKVVEQEYGKIQVNAPSRRSKAPREKKPREPKEPREKKPREPKEPREKKERNLKPVIWALAAICVVLVAATFIVPRFQSGSPSTRATTTQKPVQKQTAAGTSGMPEVIDDAKSFQGISKEQLNEVMSNPAKYVGKGFVLYGFASVVNDKQVIAMFGAEKQTPGTEKEAATAFPFIAPAVLTGSAKMKGGDLFKANVTVGEPVHNGSTSYPYMQISKVSVYDNIQTSVQQASSGK